MENKSILFVDDEPNILSGLKRMLRGLRKEVDLNFVNSAAEALEFLAQNNVDVIVSDMRMPGMDGATLLKRVQKQYPQVMRMILSGHADQSAIFETVGVAHQFLAKPTSAETLKEVLARACRLQGIFTDQSLKTLVTKFGSLPSLPSVYAELEQKLKNPECSVDDVAAVIEKDMAMSVKVLQLVNSSFFGLYRSVESPARAVSLLGIDTVKALVLNVGIFSELTEESQQSIQDIELLWNHSLGVASFAKHIIEIEGGSKECIAHTFIAGLLHDIGKLLFMVKSAREYQQMHELASRQAMLSFQAEQEVWHTDHSKVGGYLLGLWGLPGPVVEAVAFHHSISEYPGPSMSPAVVVHAVDAIFWHLHAADDFTMPEPNLAYLERAGCGTKYDVWLAECRKLENSKQQ